MQFARPHETRRIAAFPETTLDALLWSARCGPRRPERYALRTRTVARAEGRENDISPLPSIRQQTLV